MDPGRSIERRLDHLMSFADPVSYADAFLLSGWSVADEVEELVQMARQSDDLRLKLLAITRLHRNALEALTLGGLLRRVALTAHDAAGNTMTVQQVATAATNAQHRLADLSDRLLQKGNPDANRTEDCIHKPPSADRGQPGSSLPETTGGPGPHPEPLASAPQPSPADDLLVGLPPSSPLGPENAESLAPDGPDPFRDDEEDFGN